MGRLADMTAFLFVGRNLVFCWLAVLVVLLIIEMATLGLTTIWFAAGALAAALAAGLGALWPVQLLLFFAVSFVLLIFTRPVVQRRLNDSRAKTNVNSMIGREGRVTEEVDNFNEKGRIVVGGMEWTARTERGQAVIPVGERVIIREIRGVKAIVGLAPDQEGVSGDAPHKERATQRKE